MKRMGMTFLLLLITNILFGQNFYMTYNSGNKTFDDLYDQTILLAKSNDENAYRDLKKLQSISEKENNVLVKTKYLLATSNVMRVNANLPLAEFYLQSAEKLGKNKLEIQPFILFNKYLLSEDQQKHDDASKYLFQILKHYESTKNTYGEARILAEIGTYYTRMQDMDAAKKYLKKADELSKHINNKDLLYITAMYNAYTTDIPNELIPIKKNIENLLPQIKKEPKYNALIGRYYSTIANIDMRLGDNLEAIKYSDSAISVAKGNYEKMYYLSYKAFALKNIGKLREVEELYRASIKMAGQTKNYALEEELRNYLLDYYIENKEENSAINEFQAIRKLDDSLKVREKKIFTTEMDFKYETEKKEAELAFNKKNAALKNIIFTGIAILLLIIIFLFKQKLNKKEIEKKYIEEQQRNNKLQQEVIKQELENANRELTTQAIHHHEKDRMLLDIQKNIVLLQETDSDPIFINSISKKIKETLSKESDWEKVKLHFDKVHPDFFANLSKACPELSQNDLKYCAYLVIGLNNKEIARMIGVEPNSVKVTKHRIKKKLNLKIEEDLPKFLSDFTKNDIS